MPSRIAHLQAPGRSYSSSISRSSALCAPTEVGAGRRLELQEDHKTCVCVALTPGQGAQERE